MVVIFVLIWIDCLRILIRPYPAPWYAPRHNAEIIDFGQWKADHPTHHRPNGRAA